jgi:hypothetical protein
LTLSPVKVESFGGLNLVDDPGEIGWTGAVDCLNVDFDRHGRIRSRGGYAKFNAAANANAITGIASYYQSGSSDYVVIADTGNKLRSYDTSGVLQATSAATAGTNFLATRFGTDAAERLYIANGAERVWRLEGTTYTLLGVGPTPTSGLTVTPWDNRLVYLATNGETSRVEFSDAGAPETVGANNYIRFTPGDGEKISGGCSWSNQVFIFKPDKFFVVYGTSTDSSGNPIFNYHTVEGGVGAGAKGSSVDGASRPCIGTPYGVCFVHTSGVYLTTGGAPTLLSGPLAPLFNGDLPPLFTGLSRPYYSDDITKANLAYLNGCLYVSIPDSTGTTVSKTWVYEFERRIWTFSDLPARQMVAQDEGTGGVLLFVTPTSHASATRILNHGNVGYAQTTDDGTAITSRYRSGFSDMGTPDKKRVHSWRLQGTGAPTLKLSTDFGSLETGATVTLGTSPAVAQAVRRYAPTGREFSFQLGATSAWSVNSVVANVAGKKDTND